MFQVYMPRLYLLLCKYKVSHIQFPYNSEENNITQRLGILSSSRKLSFFEIAVIVVFQFPLDEMKICESCFLCTYFIHYLCMSCNNAHLHFLALLDMPQTLLAICNYPNLSALFGG